ncbi:MAG: hypothetical protein Q7R35_03060 [Elusimicrobiota bacterium]|nr:hypothetical protein [Elusimicrobiota bacterium]
MNKFGLPLVFLIQLVPLFQNYAAAETPQSQCFCVMPRPGEMPPYYIARFSPPPPGCEGRSYTPNGNGTAGLSSCGKAGGNAKTDQAAGPGKVKVNKMEFKDETLYYPLNWKCHKCKQGEELIVSIIHYQWDTLSENTPRNFPWAYFQVGKSPGACSPITSTDFVFIKDLQVAGAPAKMYEVKKSGVPVDVAGKSQPQLMGDKELFVTFYSRGACYDFAMIAHKKYFDRFWKDFLLIMQNFEIRRR